MMGGRDYVEWLKSLGCLVYLPLSSQGDLTDRISGLSLQLTGDGSLTWDSNKGMYLLTYPSTEGHTAHLSNGLNGNSFTTGGLTTLCVAEKGNYLSSTNYNSAFSVHGEQETQNGLACIQYLGSGSAPNIPSGTHRYAKTMAPNGDRVLYYDGSAQSFFYYAPQMPSSWTTTQDGIMLGWANHQGRYGAQIYIKELYIFDGALPSATINKIQQLNVAWDNIAYLRNTSGAYIDTLINPTHGTRVSMRVRVNNNSAIGTIIGSRALSGSSATGGYAVFPKASNYNGYWFKAFGAGTYTANSALPTNKIININFANGVCSITSEDGSYSASVDGNQTATFSGNYPLYLYELNTNGSVNGFPFLGDIIYALIYNGDGTLARYYVPVKHNGKGKLLDRVSGQFFGSESQDDFVCGDLL